MPTTSHPVRFSALFSLLFLSLSLLTIQTTGCGSSPPEPEGRTCSSHDDCPDGLCLDRECTDEIPSGDKAYLETCRVHQECESGFCVQTGEEEEEGRCSVACGGAGHCADDEIPGWGCETIDDGEETQNLCFPPTSPLCTPCGSDHDCPGAGAQCLELEDGSHCGRDCSHDGLCPAGFLCEDRGDSQQCVPESNTCTDCPGVDLDSDVDNCGACGRSCAASNAAVDCVDAQCVILSCESGFGSCDENPASGCETDIQSDRNHCGACGSECNPLNATGFCDQGTCQILGCDEGYQNVDGSAETGCEYSCADDPVDVDIPNDEYLDQNCDGIHGTRSAAYFVSPIGDDNNTGTTDAPFATIQRAIDAAAEDPDRWQVLVARGTYHEQVELAEGVSIWGQYDPQTWLRSPTHETIIQSPQPLAMIVQEYRAEGYIEGLIIQAADASGDVRSSRALLIRNVPEFQGTLIVRNNLIIAGAGQDGTNGTDGSQGANGNVGQPGEDGALNDGASAGGFGGSISCAGNGGRGGEGTFGGGRGGDGWPGQGSLQGDGGNGGFYSDGDFPCEYCCAFANDGHDGSPASADGPDGDHGERPDNQPQGVMLRFSLYDWYALAGDNGEDGEGGSGGGGGGGGAGLPSGTTCSAHSGGGGGGGGSGGCGGSGGEGGQGGGGSIGIVLANAPGVQLLENEIRTSDGGQGGNGGIGAEGGFGAQGRSGGNHSSRAIENYTTGAGADGAEGGDGGTGGGGAGGAGGASLGLVIYGSMSQNDLEMNGNLFDLGSAGSGGDGAPRATDSTNRAPDGANGLRQSILEID